jgi:Na+-translocating ferredoxin:NAD+ oxidoreductase RnfG subunit
MKKQSFTGWKKVSSLSSFVIAFAGQNLVIHQNNQAFAAFVGVKELSQKKLPSLNDAMKAAFLEASSFDKLNINLTDEILKDVAKQSSVTYIPADRETQIFAAKTVGKVIGYNFIHKVYGKHELITYLVGIDMSGSIKHIEILEYKETYGWQIEEQGWRQQFVGKTISSNFVLDEGVKNISGATLSCKHVSDGAKKVLTLYKALMKDGMLQ